MSFELELSTQSLHHFSTEESPDAMRSEVFRNHMASMFAVGLKVNSGSSQPFSARMQGFCGHNLRIASLHLSAHSTVSEPISHSTDARMLVSLHRAGQALIAQDGRESRIEPGDLFIIDPTRPFYIETGEIHTHSVYVSARVLRQHVPEVDQITARAITCRSGPAQLFKQTVESVFQLTPLLDNNSADHIAEALLHLLTPALRSGLSDQTRLPTRLESHHRQRIFRFIRENLSDSSLDALTVAKAVNLSPRHVYQIFDEGGKPLMKWVWAERLARCKRDLAQSTLQTRSISEIAYAWGFNNMSHFSRAFKAEFGITPREWRQNARGNIAFDSPVTIN